MHELSLVINILQMAEAEAARHHASGVEAVRMEIGHLSGVEMDAFRFAWDQGTGGTVLQGAKLEVARTDGMGTCRICKGRFPVKELYSPCPVCGSYDVDIEKGKELRVQSLLLITD